MRRLLKTKAVLATMARTGGGESMRRASVLLQSSLRVVSVAVAHRSERRGSEDLKSLFVLFSPQDDREEVRGNGEHCRSLIFVSTRGMMMMMRN